MHHGVHNQHLAAESLMEYVDAVVEMEGYASPADYIVALIQQDREQQQRVLERQLSNLPNGERFSALKARNIPA